MSTFKGVLKKGWHPEKEGTTFKGQVNSVLGRKKDDVRDKDHVARPLGSLKDPDSFAPPPRRTGTGLDAAPPPSTAKRSVVAAPSKYQDPRSNEKDKPVTFSHEQAQEEYEAEQAAAEQDEGPKPYSMNTTGLRTDHLPAPPGRRDGADGRTPASTATSAAPKPKPKAGAAPGLPPRLPARGPAPPPPPRQQPDPASLNQGAVDRLGAAGVSVPGFGIGGNSAQVNELQNRFSKMSTTTSTTQAPEQGTTWAQKRAALDTASKFKKDPSSVSLSDAKAAASTANNFRQRHGEQVAAGAQKASAINQKYGVADKLGGFAANTQGQESAAHQQQQGQGAALLSAVGGLAAKKKAPPPPPKKPGLGSLTKEDAVGDDEPPPVPMATRPAF